MPDKIFNERLEEERTVVERARQELVESQKRMLRVYLDRVQEYYAASNEVAKTKVLDGLDVFITRMEDSRIVEIFPIPNRKNLAFDASLAIEVRKKKYPVRSDFLRELGLDPRGCVVIERYERGQGKPCNPPRGKIPKLYLTWLKEHGYNPFNL